MPSGSSMARKVIISFFEFRDLCERAIITLGPNFGRNALYYEFGVLGGEQGKRNDINELFAMAQNGASQLQMAEANFAAWSRCHKALDRYLSFKRPTQTEPRKKILLVGKPGIGKSKWAYDKYPNIFEIPITKDFWFDGYDGQKEILLDEFNGQFPLSLTLKLLDAFYVRQVPIKGSFVWFNPSVIVLTTNTHPSLWYDYKDRPLLEDALRRRFIDFGTVYDNLKIVDDVKAWWPTKSDGVAMQTLDNNYLSGKTA